MILKGMKNLLNPKYILESINKYLGGCCMEKLKEERIKEIDERIKDLQAHMEMWEKVGGRGGMMAMNAHEELKELKLEREDLINGTNKLAIYRIEKELQRLTYLRRDANVFQRIGYNSKIKKLEKELYALKDRDRNIVITSESFGMEENQLTEEDLDHAVAAVPDEVALEMAKRHNLLNSSHINDEPINIDETAEMEEKGRSR